MVQGTGATSNTCDDPRGQDVQGRPLQPPRLPAPRHLVTALKHVAPPSCALYATSRDAAVTVPVTAYPVADDTWADTALTWPGPVTGAALSTVNVTAAGA